MMAIDNQLSTTNLMIMSPQLQHHNFNHPPQSQSQQTQPRNIVHVPPSFLLCNQPPPSYHQAAAASNTTVQSISNSKSFDTGVTNEIYRLATNQSSK